MRFLALLRFVPLAAGIWLFHTPPPLNDSLVPRPVAGRYALVDPGAMWTSATYSDDAWATSTLPFGYEVRARLFGVCFFFSFYFFFILELVLQDQTSPITFNTMVKHQATSWHRFKFTLAADLLASLKSNNLSVRFAFASDNNHGWWLNGKPQKPFGPIGQTGA